MKKTEHPHPTLLCATQQDWETWLNEHHTEQEGIWLKLAKKSAGMASVSYLEAVESALCYGWIDGQKASFDEQFSLQKFTPRRSRSIWSRINRERATALIAAGRMQSAGLRQVELAQADGRWERAYDSQSQSTVPADFQSELDKNPLAQAFFDTLDRANRYAILFRIHHAGNRAASIQKFIDMLARQEKIHS